MRDSSFILFPPPPSPPPDRVLGDKAVPAAKLLIDRGGNVDERNADGNTPFLVAIRYGRLDLAQLLEEKGAVRALHLCPVVFFFFFLGACLRAGWRACYSC